MNIPLAIFSMLCVTPFVAYAHGADELVVEKDGYRAELSSQLPFPLTAGETGRLNFDLFSATTSENMEGRYDRVWVRMMRGGTIHFGTWLLKPPGLLSGFTYAFPEAGEYEITVRFVRDETPLVEASYRIAVVTGAAAKNSFSYPFLFLVSGFTFLVGVIITKRFVGTR